MPAQTLAGAIVADAVTGGSAYARFDATHAHIGVGNGTTAQAGAQTDLQGASKLRKPMDSGYPTVTDNTAAFASTFGTGDANWAWNEWGVFNALSAGQMLNRKQEAIGTKTSTAVWQIAVTLTFNY